MWPLGSRNLGWVTDYTNKYARTLERKTHNVLVSGLRPGETIQVGARAMFTSPDEPDRMIEAYVVVTSQRTMIQLLNTRRPWKLPLAKLQFENSQISELLVPTDRSWCRVTVRDYLPTPPIVDPQNPDNVLDGGLFVGPSGSDLVDVLTRVVREAGGEVSASDDQSAPDH